MQYAVHGRERSVGMIMRAYEREREESTKRGKQKKNIAIVKDIADAVRMMWQFDKTVVITALLRALLEAALPFIGIYLSAYVLDGLQAGMEIGTLLRTTAAAVALALVMGVLKSYLKKVYSVHAYSCFMKFEMQLGRQTLALDYELLDNPSVNEIRTHIRNDHNWGSGFYSVIDFFSWSISSLFELSIAAGIMAPLFVQSNLFKEPSALFLLAGFLGIILFSTWFSAIKKQSAHRIMDEASKVRFHAEYFLSGQADYRQGKDIRTYKAQKLIESYLCKMDTLIGKWLRDFTAGEAQSGAVSGLALGILQTFAYLFVVFRAVSGALTIGLVLKYAATIYRFCTSLSSSCLALSEFSISVRRQQSMLEYRNVKDVLYKGSLPVEKRFFCEERDNDYEIVFCNVSFRYPGCEQYALRNFSFRFRTGQRLAVVGMNGSGKTTFIKLLCRLYDPDEGEILLNGINIKKYDYEEYQSIFSVVFQDFKIFAFSAAENVAASMHYDEKKVDTCLIRAGFGERLASLPEGSRTYLYHHFDKNGVEISGGEAQKIALARALYKDAPFIILDEPTAALDPIAEFDVYSRFNEIIENKTAVYISHRLSSCRFCDDIAVFDKGRLVQRGRHEELVADKNGKYYELWQAQARYYDEKSAAEA